LMVSHRLFSISSVFGGKNSKEIAGVFIGCPSDAAVVSSVIGSTNSTHSDRTLGLAAEL
jgi:hypothetical protein